MRVSLKFLVIAAVLTAALGAVAATPIPDAPKPCVCPYKSPTACLIYCGIL